MLPSLTPRFHTSAPQQPDHAALAAFTLYPCTLILFSSTSPLAFRAPTRFFLHARPLVRAHRLLHHLRVLRHTWLPSWSRVCSHSPRLRVSSRRHAPLRRTRSARTHFRSRRTRSRLAPRHHPLLYFLGLRPRHQHGITQQNCCHRRLHFFSAAASLHRTGRRSRLLAGFFRS